MYYIHNYVENTWTSFDDWWKLVDHFYVEKRDEWGFSNRPFMAFDNIAHSLNDKKVGYVTDIYITVYVPRTEIIYDEYMRVVNTSDIKKSLKVYNPDRKPTYAAWYKRNYDRYKHIRFRFDPIPGWNWKGKPRSWKEKKKKKQWM